MSRAGGALASLGIVVTAILGPPAASAATIKPTTFADEYGMGAACSLREAVEAANTNAPFGGCPAGGGPDRIPLARGIYRLTIQASGFTNGDGSLDVITGSEITLVGAASGSARSASVINAGPGVADPGAADRVLVVASNAGLTASRVTFYGGSISAGNGGGIFSQGTLSLTNSTITGNEVGMGFGAGLSTSIGGITNMTNVTVSDNRAEGAGGGIANVSTGVTHLNNVTVSDNAADTDGDGGDGGGIFNSGASFTLKNTIVAGNTDGSPGAEAPDCGGPLTSGGHNLIGSTAGCGSLVTGAGDQLGGNAKLGPLANNGGATLTHALRGGSPAINKGGSDCEASDQRGVPRRGCDKGAYERAKCGGVLVNRVGTAGADRLIGTSKGDGLLGLGGGDVLSGLGGGDGLCGGRGRDTLKGGFGADRLIGAKGRDHCRGGPGRDRLRSC